MLKNEKSEDPRLLRLGKRLNGSYSKSKGLVLPLLAVAGWVAMSSPSVAVTASYYNDYRVCAARLLSVGITAEGASQACATALRPSDLSACVYRIQKQTQIPATDALSPCRQARRPLDLSTCVIGINQYTKEAVNPGVLGYCGRSLSPVSFAQCVVGLRAEIDFATTQAFESCIDAGDRVSGFLPSFIPAPNRGVEFKPTFDTTPSPAVKPPITIPPSTPTPVVPPATAPNSGTPTRK